MINSIIQEVTKASDLEQLKEIVTPVIGKKCWEAYLGYGDELVLKLGKRIPYTNPPIMIGLARGEWQFSGRGTDWDFYTDSGDAILFATAAETEQGVKIIIDAEITALEVDFPSLGVSITFSNNHTIKLFPKPEDDEFDIAYWELLTPDNMIVEVGPGAKWSYEPGEAP